jgi:hypothetical protein
MLVLDRLLQDDCSLLWQLDFLMADSLELLDAVLVHLVVAYLEQHSVLLVVAYLEQHLPWDMVLPDLYALELCLLLHLPPQQWLLRQLHLPPLQV